MTAITRVYNWLQDGNEITGQMIADLIKENGPKATTQKNLHERFKGTKEGVPVLNRTFPIENASKVNNKLANDYFSDIINTKIGYFTGKPVTYKYVLKSVEGKNPVSEDVDQKLNGFLKRNQVSDLDAETAKISAVTGMAARLCFNNTDGEAQIINIPPWECVFISDEIGISEAPYAIRYYMVENGDEKYTKAEFYDEANITFWTREDDGTATTAFILDASEPVNPQPHMMAACPLICFPNNEELIGDCDKVLSLIDGYDRTLSDVNSEIEQFRLAYLAFYGSVPKDEDLQRLRQTGVIGFPEPTDRAEYITKNLNDVAVENHLNRLEDNIIYLSQSVRFTDESFGTASGVAMKFKLFNLESKCMIAERKFIKALYRQFQVLSGYFTKKGITYDPWQFEFVFTRNFPLNLLDESQTLATLKGLVSDETAYGQMSFIDDPAKEIERKKAEDEEYNRAAADIEAAARALNQQEDTDGVQGEEGQGERQAVTTNA